MPPKVDRDALRTQLGLLFPEGTRGHVRSWMLWPDGTCRTLWVGLEDGPPVGPVADWVDSLQGEDTCAYLGRWPYAKPYDGDGMNVDTACCLTLDVDAVHPRDEPATNAELAAALAAAHEVTNVYGGMLLETGNGYQIFFPLSSPVDLRGRRSWWSAAVAVWQREVTCITDGMPGHKWDPQHDLSRGCRMAGTWNGKGRPSESRPHRPTRWVTGGVVHHTDPEDVLQYGEAETKPAREVPMAYSIPDRFWSDLSRDARLADAWMGRASWISDTSPSGQDMALVARLRALGYHSSEAAAILSRRDGSKAAVRGDYLTTTVAKAYGL